MVETRRDPQSVGSNNNLSFKLHVYNRAASKGKWRMKFNDWFWCLYGITWYYIVLRGKLPLAMHAKVLPGSVLCELNHTVWSRLTCATRRIYIIYISMVKTSWIMKKWGAMYLAFRREDMEDKIIKREDDRKTGWWRWSSFLPLPPQLMTGLISLTLPRTQKINSTILFSLAELPAYISSQPDVKAH